MRAIGEYLIHFAADNYVILYSGFLLEARELTGSTHIYRSRAMDLCMRAVLEIRSMV
jgi:hypothetical protein